MGWIAILLIVAIGLPSPAIAQQPECVDPTPGDSAWWRWTTIPNGDGSASMTAPEAPGLPASFRPSSLSGTYLLRLIPTVGPERGKNFHGRIELTTGSAGIAEATDGWPAYLSFAPDTLSHSTQEPVDVEYWPPTRQLSFVIGNQGMRWTDAGVSLEVFTASESLLVGRWIDGGLMVFGGPEGPHPQGWFCLSRP